MNDFLGCRSLLYFAEFIQFLRRQHSDPGIAQGFLVGVEGSVACLLRRGSFVIVRHRLPKAVRPFAKLSPIPQRIS